MEDPCDVDWGDPPEETIGVRDWHPLTVAEEGALSGAGISPETQAKLGALRQSYQERGAADQSQEEKRRRFARWLLDHGRLSE